MSASVSDRVETYFAAWNDRDPAGVVAALVPGGTYSDPNVIGPPLSGDALASYASGLFAGFPDLRFELCHVDPGADGSTIARFVMFGTNTGPLRGNPPSGRAVKLPGVDIMTIAPDGIRAVDGMFDRQTLADQMGLQVIVQPHAVGPFQFGSAVRADSGNRARPGVFSLTWIDVRSDEEAEEVRAISRPLAAELTKEPGFISWIGVVIANRLYTITAWETEEAAQRIMRTDIHRSGVQRFFTDDLGSALHTGIWQAARLNPQWVRCPCGAEPIEATATGDTCTCGQPAPEPLSYW